MRNVGWLIFSLCCMMNCGADLRPKPQGYVENSYNVWVPEAEKAKWNAMYDLAVKIAGESGLDSDKLVTLSKNWSIIWESSNDEGAFYFSEYGGMVEGYTDCAYREMHLGRPASKFGGVCTSAFYHELMHVYEGCAVGNHVDWDKKGFYKAESDFMFRCLIDEVWK